MGRLRIGSREQRPFEDRAEAGRLLGEALRDRGKGCPLVLGIPRGGLIVAQAMADVLQADFDALFALKIGFPGNPELALGAVAEGGNLYVDETYIERMGLRPYFERERSAKVAELSRRTGQIRALFPRIPLAGRKVIVTDDGVATGSTFRAAIPALRREGPEKITAAFPVALEGALDRIAAEADETFCLRCPEDFLAVGQFYRHFEQVEDAAIKELFSSPTNRKG